MVDFANLDIDTVDQLVSVLEDELGKVSTKWWNANKTVLPGYLRSLAEATIQTREALAGGVIPPQAADMILHNQELAFNQTLQFTKLMTLVLAQQLLNAAFTVIGWVIFNKTGINLAPNLVRPAATT
jgi:energy-converting hydrogenase Eha subunit F